MRQVGTLLGNYKWPTVKLMNYMPVCHNLYLTPDCSRSGLFQSLCIDTYGDKEKLTS